MGGPGPQAKPTMSGMTETQKGDNPLNGNISPELYEKRFLLSIYMCPVVKLKRLDI